MEYADVATAAAGLEKDGVKPTVLLVRAKLGKGSLRDITPLLKRWKAERKGQSAAATAALPEHIAQAIAAIIAQERAAAIQTMQAELEEVTKERDELAEALAAKEDSTHETALLLTAERERAAGFAGQIESLKELIAKVEAERDAERERRITAERAQAAAEARIEEIRAATTQKATPKTTRKKQENLPL